MYPKLLCLVWTCLLTLGANLNAQQTFKLNENEQGWTYHTAAQLHTMAKKHLAELDAQIADKKKVSESLLNPFKETARARYDELIDERKKFLDQTWMCPHWFWKKCDNCGGDGTVYSIFTCSVCKGNKGKNSHGIHPDADAEHTCFPPTIRALLKVTD